MNYEKRLIESSSTGGYPNAGGLCGNDDTAPSTVLMGDVTVRTKSRESINGLLNIHKPLKDYIWHELEYAEAAADLDNYHDSLIGVNKLMGKNIFTHHEKGYHAPHNPLQFDRHKLGGNNGDEGLDDSQLHKEISGLIRSYMKTMPSEYADTDLGISPIKEGVVAYLYPKNEDFTIDLVDVADENNCSFNVYESNDYTNFIMVMDEELSESIGSLGTNNLFPDTLFGEKMVSSLVNTINGPIKIYISEPEFNWSEWKESEGMADKKNYHASLLGIEKLINREGYTLFKNIKRSKDDKAYKNRTFRTKAKEPLGKEPETSVKVDVTKDEIKTKTKSTGKPPEVKVNQQDKEYKDVKATSVDKDISTTVMKNITEGTLNELLDKYGR